MHIRWCVHKMERHRHRIDRRKTRTTTTNQLKQRCRWRRWIWSGMLDTPFVGVVLCAAAAVAVTLCWMRNPCNISLRPHTYTHAPHQIHTLGVRSACRCVAVCTNTHLLRTTHHHQQCALLCPKAIVMSLAMRELVDVCEFVDLLLVYFPAVFRRNCCCYSLLWDWCADWGSSITIKSSRCDPRKWLASPFRRHWIDCWTTIEIDDIAKPTPHNALLSIWALGRRIHFIFE